MTPEETITLSSASIGIVEEIYAGSGDLVPDGEPILRLSSAALELDVLTREAQATEQLSSQRSLQISLSGRITQNLLEAATVDYRIQQLEAELSRATRLVETGSGTAAHRDELQVELSFQREKADLLREAMDRDTELSGEMQNSFSQNENLLSDVAARRRAQLDALTIRAPLSGQVNGLVVTVGEQIAAGAPLATIDVPGSSKLVFQADEFHLPRIAVGQQIVASIGGDNRSLIVSSVSSRVQDGVFQFEAVFEGAQPDGLRRGQAVTGRLLTGDGRDEALMLPVGPYLEASGGRWVFVVGVDGLARKISVVPGRRTSESFEVLSGLDVGSQVIISSYATFADYEIVEIQ